MTDQDRPSCITHWSDIERPDTRTYRGDDELMSIGAALGRHFGLTRLGIHHERLPPGRRTSFPHAESAEEEFVYVIEGTPDVWLDGELHRLKPGDSVGFPAGTGLAHTFMNNSEAEVRLLVVGEPNKPENRLYYPTRLDWRETRSDWWDDVPKRPLGPHDGMPDAVRAEKAAKNAAKETTGE
ncbi:cupin domain-containing protein [Neorhizobium galegae]|uniref:cupin domain-containing protein n=1 Tax=Neorhizobium galegae TaxID=399 RepID=UPI000621958E|nr:cupin domain-containing protein [Neorhizobium galegae]MCQ1851777.1 cupin domain-containing protein [Neorhizobium galegae]CDZ48814.1 Cupin domain protein [Neorhizobium galegae bv. orientalis]